MTRLEEIKNKVSDSECDPTLADIDYLLELVEKQREFIEMCVGFCVAFREDNTCWNEHQDVGVLFAKAKETLAKEIGE